MPKNSETTDTAPRCRRCGCPRNQHYVIVGDMHTGCLTRRMSKHSPGVDVGCDCGGYEHIEQTYCVRIDIDHAPEKSGNWLDAYISDDSAQPSRTLSCSMPVGGQKERLKAWNHFVSRIAEHVGIIPEYGNIE